MQHEERLYLAFRRYVTSPLECGGVKGVTLNWNNIWNDLFWDTCASEDILVEYIAYYIHLGVRHDGIFGISGTLWIQCDLFKSKPFPSWSQSSI